MKLKLASIFSTAILLACFALNANAYSIKIYSDLPDQCLYLGLHYGHQSVIVDSTAVRNGNATFKSKNKLQQGIYFISNSDKVILCFPVDSEQKISMQIENGNVKFSGCRYAQIFNEAHATISCRQATAEYLKGLCESTGNSSMAGLVFQMAYAAAMPGSSAITDMDFSNERLLYAPSYAFEALLEQYCTNEIDIHSNSLEKAFANADLLVDKTSPKGEYRKFILNYMVSRYENPDNRKLEAMFCHLFQRYYSEAKPWWISDYEYSVLKWKQSVKKDNLIGMTGKEILLPDASGNPVSLYALNAKYKVVVFWDSECEVCIEAVSNLQAEYQSLKEINAEVYAVYTEAEYDQWKEYIVENDLTWINVDDPESTGTYEYDYGTYKTPRFYILDEHNVIIDKDFNPARTYEAIIEYRKLSNGKNY